MITVCLVADFNGNASNVFAVNYNIFLGIVLNSLYPMEGILFYVWFMVVMWLEFLGRKQSTENQGDKSVDLGELLGMSELRPGGQAGGDGASCLEGLSGYLLIPAPHTLLLTLLGCCGSDSAGPLGVAMQNLALVILLFSSSININKQFWIFKELLDLEPITETSSLFT